LPAIIERAWSIVFEEMRVGATVNGWSARSCWSTPALPCARRSSTPWPTATTASAGRRIEMRMYADRLEIISPGGLPGYMTIDNLVEEHFSRNPAAGQRPVPVGFIEELGLGIDQMIEEMVQAGHPPPEFRATPHSFTVTLSNKRERP
jgi:ATP-dependent DNA helicase RecG